MTLFTESAGERNLTILILSGMTEQTHRKRQPGGKMDKLIEQSLKALLAREGLEPKERDLEEFSEIIELYVGNLKQLHSVDLGPEEPGPVFRPDAKS